MLSPNTPQAGFALLMTLLIISVVIPVALTILDVSMKQSRLSGITRDSEVAFGATSAGAECAQYLRRLHAGVMEDSTQADIAMTCREISTTAVEQTPAPGNGGVGRMNHFTYDLSWGAGALEERCARVVNVVLVSPSTEAMEIDASAVQDAIPTFPSDPAVISCAAGGRCSFISVQGHNRLCPTGGAGFPLGTVQREVLLEF